MPTIVFLVICLYFVYEARKVSLDAIKRIEFRFRLFALRDKLRDSAIAGEIDYRNWEFRFLDRVLSQTVGKIGALKLRQVCQTSVNIKQLELLDNNIRRINNPIIQDIFSEFIDVMYEYLEENYWLSIRFFDKSRLRCQLMQNLLVM